MLKGLSHCVQRGLTLRHLKVLLGVQMMLNITHSKLFPNASQIAGMINVLEADFEPELDYLVEERYLHRIHPNFGPLIYTYKLGAMGGTLMRLILSNGQLKPGGVIG